MEKNVNTEERYDRRDYAILALPEEPDDLITWIVYNSDMCKFIENRIIQLRGQEYFNENVQVLSRESAISNTGRSIYYDPYLYDHLGNGQ